jgi:hypothetical protein
VVKQAVAAAAAAVKQVQQAVILHLQKNVTMITQMIHAGIMTAVVADQRCMNHGLLIALIYCVKVCIATMILKAAFKFPKLETN